MCQTGAGISLNPAQNEAMLGAGTMGSLSGYTLLGVQPGVRPSPWKSLRIRAASWSRTTPLVMIMTVLSAFCHWAPG